MDFLFFCTSECDDALRDRDFYLAQNCDGEEEARKALDIFFSSNDYNDFADNYSVFVSGSNIKEGTENPHYCFRFQIIN